MERAEPLEYQLQHIRNALYQDPRVGEMTLEVTLAGGKVFVAGQVPTAQRRAAVVAVVRDVAPTLEVVNEVTVVPCDEPEEEERLS